MALKIEKHFFILLLSVYAPTGGKCAIKRLGRTLEMTEEIQQQFSWNGLKWLLKQILNPLSFPVVWGERRYPLSKMRHASCAHHNETRRSIMKGVQHDRNPMYINSDHTEVRMELEMRRHPVKLKYTFQSGMVYEDYNTFSVRSQEKFLKKGNFFERSCSPNRTSIRGY